MHGEIKLERLAIWTAAVCLVLLAFYFLIREDPAEKPYLKVVGGSFIFNYRVSDIYMGFSAIPEKPIPVGSTLVVSFENPASDTPFVVTRQIGLPDRSISVRSPSMRGVQANVPYQVSLQLLKTGTQEPFWRHDFSISSNISDDIVPDEPLVIGPGYHPASMNKSER